MRSIERKPPTGAEPGRLRAILHRGDPAGDGREPSPEEVRLLRARVLEEVRSASRRGAREGTLRPARVLGWAALACVALLVAAGAGRLWRDAPPPGPGGPATAARSAEPAPRQVQFTTPGGTRIVWVLYPETP